MLTHFHVDYVGGAAEVAAWGDVEVVAHRADAPFIRAGAVGPPDLADWERPIYEQVMTQIPDQERVRVLVDAWCLCIWLVARRAAAPRSGAAEGAPMGCRPVRSAARVRGDCDGVR